MLFGIQSGLLLVGTLIFLAFKAWAFVDALTHRAEAYEAAGKLTKQAWCAITGLGFAAQLILIGSSPLAKQGPDHLVQRVVPPNVLAHDPRLARRIAPSRGVDGMCLGVQCLPLAKRLARPRDRRGSDAQRRRHGTHLAQRLVDRLHAAQSAAGPPGDLPAA